MCTLSLVSSIDGGALRVVMNRDERRLRAAALPPFVSKVGGRRSIFPVDNQEGGTWIAVTDAGLLFALLNAHDDTTRAVAGRSDRVSRGTVIPRVIGAADLDGVEALWASLDRGGLAPFRLVVSSLDGSRLFDHSTTLPTGSAMRRVEWDGPGTRPADMFCSSSADERVAVRERGDLFAHLMTTDTDPWRAQDRFHQHSWPDRRHVSVLMSRPDACTVSRTEVVITANWIGLRYAPIVDGWPAAISTDMLQLPLAAIAAAA
jgi:hypothetical protein